MNELKKVIEEMRESALPGSVVLDWADQLDALADDEPDVKKETPMQRDYILTHSNRRVYLPDADPESIAIEDIAHALSLNCRFAGHIPRHYSVCEHSLNVWLYCSERTDDKTVRLQALLHDATEAYIADIATPYKQLLPDYKILEANLWETIATKYGVPVQMDPLVKEADRVLLMTEKDWLRPNSEPWNDMFEAIPRWDKEPMHYDKPETARWAFLNTFDFLTESE